MKSRKTFFGKNFKRIIAEKGFTQAELAGKLGIDQAVISHWITGTRNPSLNSLKKVSDALDISFNFLLKEAGLTEKKEDDKDNGSIKIDFLEEKIKRHDAEISLLKRENEFLKKEIEFLKSK